jgi:lipoprotein-anchoring transpeptidase ErfK/SrfK
MQKHPVEIKVKISEQKLYLISDNKVIKDYSISTSKYGIGNKSGSNKTPLGLHRIVSKIGRNARIGAIFKRRRNTGKIARVNKGSGDLIITRILRLEGLQRGVNKSKDIDSFRRYIYIHGTPEEKLIGKPASHGCIRMRNSDIMKLYNLVKRGTSVEIRK